MAVHVDSTPERLTRAQWASMENVGLAPTFDVQELVLNWIAKGVGDLDVYGALVSVEVETTIEGAPTVTMTLRDPNMRVLSEVAHRIKDEPAKGRQAIVDSDGELLDAPSLVGRPVDLTLDGVVFRLAGIAYNSTTAEATLTFEHRLVYWLRRKRGARRASRKSCTRAQFILALIRELRARRYRFVCPELSVAQPVQTSRGIREALGKGTSGGVDSSGDARASGFAAGASITVKGKAATAEQRRNLQTALAAADAEKATDKPRKALVLAMIEESACVNLRGGTGDSSGVLQVRASTARGIHGLDPRDITGACQEFLRNGYWRHRPYGAIELAKLNPSWSAAQIAQACQGSAPARYAKWDADADRIVAAWKGSPGGEGGGSYVKSYQYARNADEDSWTAIQRLASEVGWRCFIVGNSVYYMSEPVLYARRPSFQVVPEHPAILELSYEMDWGKPTSEATLSVVLERWGAPPGSVVVIDGYGPPDGRWLVTGVRRDYFAVTAEVTLKQPGPAKREPASDTASRDTGGAGGDAGKLYAEAKKISDADGPYLWGGGHGDLRSVDPKHGLDCSGSCSLALYRAGMFKGSTGITSGQFASSYGKPGRGQNFTVWANAHHVFIELAGLGAAKRFDTSPHGDGGRGPRLRRTERSTAGFTPRHWPGS